MSETLKRVQALAAMGEVRISQHGYEELIEDAIFIDDVLAGLPAAVIVEDYPDAERGPTILVLQQTAEGPFMSYGESPRAVRSRSSL